MATDKLDPEKLAKMEMTNEEKDVLDCLALPLDFNDRSIEDSDGDFICNVEMSRLVKTFDRQCVLASMLVKAFNSHYSTEGERK